MASQAEVEGNMLNNSEHISKITDNELKELTGIYLDSVEYVGIVLAAILIGTITLIPVALLLALLWGLIGGFAAIQFSTLFYLSAAISYPLLMIYMVYEINHSQKIKQRISPLLKEVYKYNAILDRIETIDQLKAVGHLVEVKERNRVMDALGIMRNDIVRALKTERILRDKPSVHSSDFSLDLTPFYAWQVEENSSEYAELLNDALQIGIQIQQEMKEYHAQLARNEN